MSPKLLRSSADGYGRGESLCAGCGEIVSNLVAYRDGPLPFHWNEEGGGHTMDSAAYENR